MFDHNTPTVPGAFIVQNTRHESQHRNVYNQILWRSRNRQIADQLLPSLRAKFPDLHGQRSAYEQSSLSIIDEEIFGDYRHGDGELLTGKQLNNWNTSVGQGLDAISTAESDITAEDLNKLVLLAVDRFGEREAEFFVSAYFLESELADRLRIGVDGNPLPPETFAPEDTRIRNAIERTPEHQRDTVVSAFVGLLNSFRPYLEAVAHNRHDGIYPRQENENLNYAVEAASDLNRQDECPSYLKSTLGWLSQLVNASETVFLQAPEMSARFITDGHIATARITLSRIEHVVQVLRSNGALPATSSPESSNQECAEDADNAIASGTLVTLTEDAIQIGSRRWAISGIETLTALKKLYAAPSGKRLIQSEIGGDGAAKLLRELRESDPIFQQIISHPAGKRNGGWMLHKSFP